MEFNVNVNFSASPELLNALASLVGAKAQSTPGKVAELKPASAPAATKPATPKKETAAAQTDAAADEATGVTLEDVVAVVKEKVKLKKEKAVKALLEQHGVNKASELSSDQYEPFLEKLKAV